MGQVLWWKQRQETRSSKSELQKPRRAIGFATNAAGERNGVSGCKGVTRLDLLAFGHRIGGEPTFMKGFCDMHGRLQ